VNRKVAQSPPPTSAQAWRCGVAPLRCAASLLSREPHLAPSCEAVGRQEKAQIGLMKRGALAFLERESLLARGLLGFAGLTI
jgi:hypothetical protein